MSLFQQRKPKRFQYIPRSEKDSEDDKAESLKSHWKSVRKQGKRKGQSKTLPVLLIILGMIIAFWYLLTRYEIT
ncbi:hypothetical protein [Sediminibacter sp. Hel_I_10]|uniref:hypothetical protein n=1 Tax=Sediminibacter sp. Hel_I_10 TaxID=1392490 RepID=UPI0004796828|nr:hypothetical protein [Sediminibacter sp. Hel_I_10]